MALTEEQKNEIDKLIQGHAATRQLSSGQKWDVAVIIGSFLVASVAVLAFGGSFVVQSAATLAASSVAGEVVPRDVAEVLATESSEFQELVEQFASNPPKGAVVAFDRSDGCPVGWTDYKEARGRTIIGATDHEGDPGNQPARSLGESLGNASVTLDDNNIPRHFHTSPRVQDVPTENEAFLFSVDRDSDEGRFLQLADSGSLKVVTRGRTSFAGAETTRTEPFDNMPPYVALYFCKKE